MNPNITKKIVGQALRTLLSLAAAGCCHTVFAQGQSAVVVLSPFTVDASQDEGYRAQNTLAGTRTNANLRDVAASITVLTNDLIEDIGADNFEQMVGYTPNLEITNYDTFSPYDFTVRGVPAQRTRNYFALDDTYFRLDFYNSERAEAARGPNAILFGIAQPGGIVNTSTKRALTHRDRYEVGFKVDEHGTTRLTGDINKVLIPGKLALRLNYLDYTEVQWRGKADRNTDDRFFLTAAFTPTKNTSLRVEWENIDQLLRRQSAAHARDQSSWYFDTPAGQSRTRSLTTTAQPVLNWNTGILSNAARDQVGNYPSTRPRDVNFVTPVPRDAVLIGTSPGREDEYDLISAFWEQRIGENLSFEIGHYNLSYERLRLGWSNLGEGFFIDAEPFLADGTTPNPYFEQYFIESFGTYQGIARDQNNTRATVVYDLDLGQRWGKHTFTAYAERHEYKHWENAMTEMLYDYDINTPGLQRFSANPLAANNRMQTRRYVDLNNPSTFEWVPDAFDTARAINLYDRNTPTVNPARRFTTEDGRTAETVWATRNVGSRRDQGRELDSMMGAFQSKLFRNRLITTFGYRVDETDFYRNSSLLINDPANINNRFVSQDIDPVWDITGDGLSPDGSPTSNPPSVRRSISRTASLLYHVTDKITLAVNTSSANGLNPEFQLWFPNEASPELFRGETQEISARFVLFNGALHANLTYYQLESYGENFRASNSDNRLNDVWNSLINEGVTLTNADFSAFGEQLGAVGVSSDMVGRPLTIQEVQVRGEYDRRDRESKGLELDATANIGKNLSVFFSVSQNDTTVAGLAPRFRAYRDAVLPVWNRLVEQTPVYRDSTAGSGYTRQLANFESAFQGDITNFEGLAPAGQSKYKSAMRVKYSFKDGRLRGTDFGLGARYASGRAIGATGPGNSLRSQDEFYLDANVRYRTKILGDKATLTVSLNIDNLLDRDGIIFTGTEGDGTINNFRFITPRTASLQTTLSF